MIELSREQVIPVWARLVGRRLRGEPEPQRALQSPRGTALPWSVPVRLVDVPPVTDAELYRVVSEAMGVGS